MKYKKGGGKFESTKINPGGQFCSKMHSELEIKPARTVAASCDPVLWHEYE